MKTLQSQFVWISVGLSFAGCLVTSNGSLLYAQTIRPAADGTGTIVLPNGNQIDISGGQRSRNGANLFHSFQEFGLSPGQIANFLASPELKAIFARVAGGNPSVIDGLLQVTGSTAHLYLLNPAGIVFGSNASLNVPGSFTATTANGVRFGTQWYDAIGANNYLNLGGTPDGLVLTAAQPGAIVNAGNLAVGTGRSLNLVGGTVVNTGSLTAPAGQVTIAAVPGNRLVRLSSPGSLLSFEVNPTTPLQALPSRPATLPQLLTGGNLENATNLVVRNGQVFLSGMTRPADTAPGRVTVAGRVNASGQTGGSITILGQQVDLPRATIQATGVGNGGTVRIGGDYKGQGSLPQADRTLVDSATAIDVSSQRNGNGGRAIVWAKDVTGFYGDINAQGGSQRGNGGFVEVSGKRFLIFDGTVNLNAPNGQVGTLLLDPENITISNALTDPGVDPSRVLRDDFPNQEITINVSDLRQSGNILLEANNDITIAQGVSLNFGGGNGSITLRADANNDQAGSFRMDATQTIFSPARDISISGFDLTLGNINARGGSGRGGAVNLSATRNISTGFIATTADSDPSNPNPNPSGDVRITSERGSITISDSIIAGSQQGSSGSILLRAKGNITTAKIENQPITNQADAGSITLISEAGSIDTTSSGLNPISGALESGIFSGGAARAAGNITLQAPNGNITTGIVNSGASTTSGTINLISGGNIDTTVGFLASIRDPENSNSQTDAAGEINLVATGSIRMGNVFTNGESVGGNINLTSRTGSVTSNNLVTESSTRGGAVTINANSQVSTGNINSISTNGVGGSIKITSTSQNITVNGELTSSGTSQGGDVQLDARQTITTGAIDSSSTQGRGGNITATSTAGEINATGILSSNGASQGGTVRLNARQTVTTGAIDSSSTQGRGGNITATSTAGGINTTDTLSSNGTSQGGTVQLNARQTVTTGAIDSSSTQGRGGSITATSQAGNVTVNGTLSSVSTNGTGGAIDLTGQNLTLQGDITLGSRSGRGGGDFTLNTPGQVTFPSTISTNGANLVSTQSLNTLLPQLTSTINTGGGNVSFQFSSNVSLGKALSINTSGGDITLTSPGNLSVLGTLNTSSTTGAGGNISLTSVNGAVTSGDLTASGTSGGNVTVQALTAITAGRINTSATVGKGGNVLLDPIGDVAVTSIDARGGANGSGGDVSINAQGFAQITGSIDTSGNIGGGNITFTSSRGISVSDTLNTSSTTGTGGNIALTSVNGAVTSGDLIASGTSGGNVTVQARTAITAGRINTSATVGKGGNVLLDPIGDVQVTSIDARGGPSGSGGTVDITAQQFVRIPGLIDNSNASISATGGQPGGSITIRHGGQGITPFIVGNAALNGSAGILTTGLDNSITSGNFYFTYSQSGPSGVIRIISVDPTPLPYNDPLDELCQGKKCQPDDLSGYIFDIEQRFTRLYEPILGTDKPTKIKTLNEIRDELRNIEKESGVKPAIIYADFKPADSRECNSPGRPVFIEEKERDRLPQNLKARTPEDNDRLEIALVTAQNSVICKRIPNATQRQIATFMDDFPAEDISLTIDNPQYKKPVEQLYQWLVKELRADIDKEGIKNLVFILHPTLRSIPLPPLHDGQQLLIENYSMGYMPSMSLTNATYANIRSASALLMGTSEFSPFPELPLPSVRLELDGIQRLRQPENRSSLYDKDFTVSNLTQELAKKKVGIVHLATHAKFSLKKAEEDSYIQFRDQKLTLATARKLDWQGVELLSLSACETAIGQGDWQLGFAGFATKAGVKSVLASLWLVNDTATAALMLLFYDNLNSETTRIKAQALRQAQLTMLHGKTATELRPLLERLKQAGTPFPPNLDLQDLDSNVQEWRKPYYWSGFTIVGNPW